MCSFWLYAVIFRLCCHQSNETVKAHELFRDLAKGPTKTRSSGGVYLGAATMKQVQDSAKEERRKKYCCVRGSSALNSRSGTDAFKMSIVRQAQLLPLHP